MLRGCWRDARNFCYTGKLRGNCSRRSVDDGTHSDDDDIAPRSSTGNAKSSSKLTAEAPPPPHTYGGQVWESPRRRRIFRERTCWRSRVSRRRWSAFRRNARGPRMFASPFVCDRNSRNDDRASPVANLTGSRRRRQYSKLYSGHTHPQKPTCIAISDLADGGITRSVKDRMWSSPPPPTRMHRSIISQLSSAEHRKTGRIKVLTPSGGWRAKTDHLYLSRFFELILVTHAAATTVHRRGHQQSATVRVSVL